MTAAGFMPRTIEANTSDFVRFDAPGDKPGRKNGFYKLRVGQWSVGWFGDWKTGEQHQWFFDDGRELTAKERKSIKTEQARLKAEAAVARETKQAEVAEDAQQMWGRADSNVEGHPYLERKKIAIARGLKIHTTGEGDRLLAVPMWTFDMNGQAKLQSLQMISETGEKRFLKAGRVEGTFFSLKGDASLIVLCEGVATALSIWEATGLSVVAAFNAGNLIPVAKEFARNRPLATILIAADNDAIAPADWEQRGQGKPWVNAGRLKAEAAAKTIGCRWIFPVFEDGPGRDRTDFNDLFCREGSQAVAGQVIGALRSVEAEDAAPGATITQIDAVRDETWRGYLPQTARGEYDANNTRGVAVYLEHHRLIRNRLRFNLFTRAIEVDGNMLEDHHVTQIRDIMHQDLFKARKGDVFDMLELEARRSAYDPLLEYLAGLKWDGVSRVDSWLAYYLGAEETPYTSQIGRKFLIASVARARQPGCKMDVMLVLEGPQGAGKSTAIRYLYGDRFFVDNLPDLHSKDSFLQLQGAWAIEVGELSGLAKSEVADIKRFLSCQEDKFRPPYGRVAVSVPRRSVLVGSVNPEAGNGYLKDQTGARRFWPVQCGEIALSALLRERDQLWAEACVLHAAGEKWHLTDAAAVHQAEVEQEIRREQHPWEELVQNWLIGRMSATISEVLADCIKVPPDRQTPQNSAQAGRCLRAAGWKDKTERYNGSIAKVFRPADPDRLV